MLFKFFENIYILASAMSFYIIVGLLIAGVLKQIIPNDFISRHLGKNSFISVIKATIFGIPLPVCSCSVIPLAKSLQKEGASSGAVISFLISAPITGVDSILATYSFFGWLFTIYRVLTSVIIAIAVGIAENIFGRKKPEVKAIQPKFSLSQPVQKSSSITFVAAGQKSCCGGNQKKRFSLKSVFNYAINTLFKDIAKPLFWGLIAGALFSTFMPKEILSYVTENIILSYFAILIIAMPLYVCATSSLPIAVSFILGGMSAGSAFIFLSAGPATNSVTMGVVGGMFGKKTLALYLAGIALFSVGFGYLFDSLFGSLEVLKIVNHIENVTLLNHISTIAMFGLIFYFLIWKRVK